MTLFFQALHLLGLLLWIGPSLGGYLILLAARREKDPALLRWVRLRWQTILWVEHLGLAIVLIAGLARAWTLGWLAAPPLWLAIKLLLIGLLIVPLEAFDIAVAWWVRRAIRESPVDLDRRLAVQDRLADRSALPLAIVLVAIVCLVVWKPWW